MSLQLKTISILRGLKERYENFHGVKLLILLLLLLQHFPQDIFPTGFFPDKAIDLVDEACALVKTELDSMPTELDDVRRRVMQLLKLRKLH